MDEYSAVLEIGFGCGYSAEHIQRCTPRSHTIIECAPSVLERLRPWAATRPSVTVIEGTWQAMLPALGVFDCIFFDDVGAPGLAEREIKQCPDMRYREEYSCSRAKGRSHFHAFLQVALKWHSRVGSRIGGYLLQHDPRGLEDVDVRLSHMVVHPPEHCLYHEGSLALVPRFTKLSDNTLHSPHQEVKEGGGAIPMIECQRTLDSGAKRKRGSHGEQRDIGKGGAQALESSGRQNYTQRRNSNGCSTPPPVSLTHRPHGSPMCVVRITAVRRHVQNCSSRLKGRIVACSSVRPSERCTP